MRPNKNFSKNNIGKYPHIYVNPVPTRAQVYPDYAVIERLSDQDLRTVWEGLWASQRAEDGWRWQDPGVHGFESMQEWAIALSSELAKRGLSESRHTPLSTNGDYGAQDRLVDLRLEMINTLAESKRNTLKPDWNNPHWSSYKLGTHLSHMVHSSPICNFRGIGPEFSGEIVHCFETQNAGWVVLKLDGEQRRVVLCIG